MVKPRVPKVDYSRIAEQYDRIRPMPAGPWLSKIVEYGKIDAECAVLDVGCGTGNFPIALFAEKDCTVYALESSVEMLKRAVIKDNQKDVLWTQGDGQKLPFRDDSFNCVYMTWVIHHIESKEMAFREIYRVLKKGGRCVIVTISHSRIKRHIIHDFPRITAIDLKRFPSIPSLKKTITKVGFKDAHYHIVCHDEGYMPTEEYLERVKNKYISTLTLPSEEAFQKGLKIFQERIQKKYGSKIRRTYEYVFVVGQK